MTEKVNEEIYCGCGCGAKFFKYSRDGKERKFLRGHNRKLVEKQNFPNGKDELIYCACGCGEMFKKFSEDGRRIRKFINSHQSKRGRRTTKYKDADGYIRIYFPEHHKSNIEGWVHEHIIVAENFYGREVGENEEVHHINRIRDDNRPENIEIKTKHSHRSLKAVRTDLRKEGEENTEIECACGCGRKLLKYDRQGRPREYIQGHHMKDRNKTNKNEFHQ
jgi:hypothetical protein